jgi:hypothetical protein
MLVFIFGEVVAIAGCLVFEVVIVYILCKCLRTREKFNREYVLGLLLNICKLRFFVFKIAVSERGSFGS